MDRNLFGFLTLIILGLCYLVYISKNETQPNQPSYTIGVYNGLVQREMNTATLLDLEDSFEVIKNGLGESSDASGLAEKYKELKQRIDDELQILQQAKSKVESVELTKTIGPSSCPSPPPSPVDAVYTWVNGSDPNFQTVFKSTDLGAKTHKDDVKAQRFEDFNQLLYSVRSIEMFAPWIRKIWIVTNGQHPMWLDQDNMHVEVVPHDKIFQSKDDLPTFNSRAIESHLHQIPGVTENFLYFNDDFTLTNNVCYSDFWTEATGYKLHTKGALNAKSSNKACTEECISVKFSDGVCDQECNTLGCLWDGDDCDGVVPPGGEKDHRPGFYQAIDFVNVLFEKKLLPGAERYWMPHVPILFNKQIMADLQGFFHVFYEVTSKHRKRQKNDMQPEFSYAGWVFEAPKSPFVTLEHPELYKAKKEGGSAIFYISYWTNMAKNRGPMSSFMSRRKSIKFLCVNDLLDHEKPEAIEAKRELKKFYDKIYPTKSSFEL